MIDILFWIFLGCFIGAGAATIASFRYFDKVLKIEVSMHPEQWVRDEKPIGFFHIPQGASSLRGSIARSNLWCNWTSRPPDWLGGGADRFSDYRRFRCARRVANTLMVAMLVIFVTAVIWVFRT